MPRYALPVKTAGGRRRQSDKTQVDFPSLQRAELLRGAHVEEIQCDMGEGLAEGAQGFGEQLEIEIRRVGDIELAGFAATEALDREDALGGQSQNAAGIGQERTAFLGQRDSALGTLQQANADFLFQVVNLACKGGLG